METSGSFVMNACSLWFDHFFIWNWHQCCVQHDLDYGAHIGKALADEKLAACVNAILPGMGTIMFIGVTLFGWLWYYRAKR